MVCALIHVQPAVPEFGNASFGVLAEEGKEKRDVRTNQGVLIGQVVCSLGNCLLFVNLQLLYSSTESSMAEKLAPEKRHNFVHNGKRGKKKKEKERIFIKNPIFRILGFLGL